MTIKKVLFVRSSHYADDGRLVRATNLIDRLTIKNLAELSIPLLAAYTPKHIQVEMVDDCLEITPFDTDADVVAVTAWLIHYNRAIDLGKEFKKRGKTVVIGGYLATMHPELIEPYFDSVCVGEGDLIWPKMLEDIERGKLQKRYESDFSMKLDNVPVPRYDLIKRTRGLFTLTSSYPVQATRGCPYKCDYCSIMTFFKNTYRYRPIEHVVRDIKAHKSKEIHFVDDNLMENRTYAKELFSQLKGLGLTWGSQVTMNVAKDEEMLKLAYDAGCRVVMIGFETINQKNLNNVSKSWAKVEEIKSVTKKVQSMGIGVHALIVFGMPNDTESTFDEVVDFLIDANAFAAEFFIFTPYPKTPIGKRYIQEGRIIDCDLSHYSEPNVVFKHDNLTVKQIQDGYWRAFNRFYSLKSIFLRLYRSKYKHKVFFLALNLYYWLKIKRKIVPTHFQRGNYSYNRWRN